MKDAFGIEKAFNPLKAVKALRPKPVGSGPGSSLVPGAKIKMQPRKPAGPPGNFVEYDPIVAAQRQRGAMKASFGKRDSRKDPKSLHPLAVGAATAGGALAGQTAYIMPVKMLNDKVVNPATDKALKEAGKDSDIARAWARHNAPPEPRVVGRHSRGGPRVDPGFRGGEDPTLARPLNRGQAKKEAQSNTKRSAWRATKQFHNTWPKEMPYSRLHRALSHAGKGKTGHAIAGTMMAGGALASYKVASHKPKTKVNKGFFAYVPKTQMTLKSIVRDPGFLVPIGGITAAGAAGTALSARKYRKRKLK